MFIASSFLLISKSLVFTLDNKHRQPFYKNIFLLVNIIIWYLAVILFFIYPLKILDLL